MQAAPLPDLASPPATPAAAEPFTGWTLTDHEEVDTTNRLAAALPAWHAVRAATQTAGRGRTGRVWTSDRGGLWLSAVLPCPGPRERWSTLPLAAGHALRAALSDLGVSELRLRWPNDLLIGSRKLAGLLVERHSTRTAVVGIGLNVFNHPERADPALHRATARLADLAPLGGHDLDSLSALVLQALARAHARLLANDFPRLAEELNRAWREPRPVELTFAGAAAPVRGDFLGIDSLGRLRLRARDGATSLHDPVQVALLREL
jgi:BirA family biotin operon repressor/biotin-[acetyl-CoA-carboxylase] ligase